MRVALILGMVIGPLAVMALNIERDLKEPGILGSIRGRKRQSNKLLQAKRQDDDDGDGDDDDRKVSAGFNPCERR